MEKPLVSIIIPTYNRANLIGETLDSVIAQTYTNWECIVVDDGSSDHTDEVMASYVAKDSRFRYFHRPDNRKRGGNAARNYGFEMSKGEYINWLDSDDLMNPTKLEKQLKVLSENEKAAVCFSRAEIFSKEKRYEKKSKKFSEMSFFKDYMSRKVDMGTTQPLWRKKFLSTKNLYNEELLKGQDYDFLTRMSSSDDFQFCYVDEVLVSVRLDSDHRITEKYKSYDANLFNNYLIGYKNAFLIVCNQKDKELLKVASNVLLSRIQVALRNKDYKTAMELIAFMRHNTFQYKFHFLKVKGILGFLKLTDLKGYNHLKKHIYLP